MIRPRNLVLAATSLIALAGIATAQNASQPTNAPGAKPTKAWVAPGTKGSEIDGSIFHAQVLLSTAGFSTSVIDGQDGMVFKKAVRGFQEARGLKVSGELDGPTKAALMQSARPSTVTVKLTRDDISGDYVYPFPKKPELQAKLTKMSYRNMIEEVAERYHTTPKTLIALNGPTAMIGVGQTLRLPNVIPTARDYAGVTGENAAIFAKLNIDSQQPAGDRVVVDKSEGVLKVFDKADKLVAQFPVTMGSSKDPLPLGKWKATTYAFNPPFHYQPELFWDVDDGKAEQKLPPGPNGPVGVAWLDLTKEHYGIHGTPEPSTIGRAESHGCIRMTNWDVLRLSQMLKPGFEALFQA
ncbi:MAG: L,D-transpeptidase family protein [Sphingomonas bacterium]|nr:L,D-transpeptidase family protein [Sphingomonas bacterium]